MIKYLYETKKLDFIFFWFMLFALIIDLIVLKQPFSILNGFQVVAFILASLTLCVASLKYKPN